MVWCLTYSPGSGARLPWWVRVPEVVSGMLTGMWTGSWFSGFIKSGIIVSVCMC